MLTDCTYSGTIILQSLDINYWYYSTLGIQGHTVSLQVNTILLFSKSFLSPGGVIHKIYGTLCFISIERFHYQSEIEVIATSSLEDCFPVKRIGLINDFGSFLINIKLTIYTL